MQSQASFLRSIHVTYRHRDICRRNRNAIPQGQGLRSARDFVCRALLRKAKLEIRNVSCLIPSCVQMWGTYVCGYAPRARHTATGPSAACLGTGTGTGAGRHRPAPAPATRYTGAGTGTGPRSPLLRCVPIRVAPCRRLESCDSLAALGQIAPSEYLHCVGLAVIPRQTCNRLPPFPLTPFVRDMRGYGRAFRRWWSWASKVSCGSCARSMGVSSRVPASAPASHACERAWPPRLQLLRFSVPLPPRRAASPALA